MTDLERLTAAYQSMNPWAQSLLHDIAQDYVKRFPAPKPRPHLRVVLASVAAGAGHEPGRNAS